MNDPQTPSETEKRPFWSLTPAEVFERLGSDPKGLSSVEAQKRLKTYGYNRLKPQKQYGIGRILLAQFGSPLVLVLAAAAIISFSLGDRTDATIILIIILISGFLGFWQEYRANSAVQRMLALIRVTVTALRGTKTEIPLEEIVPGDVVVLSAGDAVPADCLIVESKDLFVDEAILTGESFPAEKEEAISAPDAPLKDRRNVLFMGTHVVSGEASVVVVNTGLTTEFGHIAHTLELRPPMTDFERGVRRFGYFLVQMTTLFVAFIFAVNIALGRPFLQSMLFSVALAVGLSPELLPAVISVTLAHGAHNMGKKGVIVKRLTAIEDFGGMNVLCSDKTGTLTQGKIELDSARDVLGGVSQKVSLYAYLNAKHETGYTNPIDQAILQQPVATTTQEKKLDEVPYDFVRKRLSILVAMENQNILITKGAVDHILPVCSQAESPDGTLVPIEPLTLQIDEMFKGYSEKGLRTLAVAYRTVGQPKITKADETAMVFLGFLVFADPPKPDIEKTLGRLSALGIRPKIITGDNLLVTKFVAQKVGLPVTETITGPELAKMTEEGLLNCVNRVDIFAEIEPNQKKLIIQALDKSGNVVGFLGDGINDASALQASDVGISVNNAVAVAKEAADIVLLEKDMDALVNGVEEGRRTFTNTLKYIYMTTSANFGNMFSMAAASLFLPFLPLLPRQILLTNLITDLPGLTITTDNVDQEMVAKPTHWDIKSIRRFMIVFGAISSLFDFLTFGSLLWLLHADEKLFHSGCSSNRAFQKS